MTEENKYLFQDEEEIFALNKLSDDEFDGVDRSEEEMLSRLPRYQQAVAFRISKATSIEDFVRLFRVNGKQILSSPFLKERLTIRLNAVKAINFNIANHFQFDSVEEMIEEYRVTPKNEKHLVVVEPDSGRTIDYKQNVYYCLRGNLNTLKDRIEQYFIDEAGKLKTNNLELMYRQYYAFETNAQHAANKLGITRKTLTNSLRQLVWLVQTEEERAEDKKIKESKLH
jgi:hypothetical protein